MNFLALWQSIKQAIVSLWEMLFPPHVTPPTPNTPITLKDIIVAYNKPIIAYYPVTSTTTINAQIHAITADQAQTIADLIESNAKRAGLDSLYLAACIMQESRFDPACFNHNLSQTYPTPTFERTDWGICQMSGTYLPSKPGMQGLTQDQMSAKACTAEWSVPVMADIMAGNLAMASKDFTGDLALAAAVHNLNTTSLSDAQFFATLAYNRGEAGAITDIKTNQTGLIKHPYRVATWYDDFTNAFRTNTTSSMFKKFDLARHDAEIQLQ